MPLWPRRRADVVAAPGADLLDRLDRERTVWLCTLPPDVVAALAERYDGWDIATAGPDGQYVLFRVDVTRWLMAGRTLTG
ncbi:hypothetical protein [Micromonospora sp. NPDC050200]|uniref:hypothetical protein n=1 Tax=Micromonospora sp. NPDC050200 TaxID=3155664 RepID=UPI0033F73DF7